MTNTLTKIEVSRLPELTPRLCELQWREENWKRAHAEAGLQKANAWLKYAEAIEDGEMPEVIEQYYIAGEIYETVCKETWEVWNQVQAQLLALLN